MWQPVPAKTLYPLHAYRYPKPMPQLLLDAWICSSIGPSVRSRSTVADRHMNRGLKNSITAEKKTFGVDVDILNYVYRFKNQPMISQIFVESGAVLSRCEGP
jgi:hypothetical protein